MNTARRRIRFCSILSLAAISPLVPIAAAQASSGNALASRHGSQAAARIVANANPATYTDPAGDSGTAPDITSVVVSNDAKNQITFRVNVAQLVVPSDNRVVIAIDSDRNGSTGTGGIDYLLIGDLSDNSFGVLHWNGSSFDDATAATATASNDATGMTFSINSSDLGNTTAFNFWARTLHGDSVAAGNHDDAPDSGSWTYQLGSAAALKLTVQLSHASKARAGKPFVALITVARSDGSRAEVTPDDIGCTATIGGRPLSNGLPLAVGPAVGCGWQLPKKSRGKTLRASVTVNLDGATVTKTFVARIK
jgi:hypothetical protein